MRWKKAKRRENQSENLSFLRRRTKRRNGRVVFRIFTLLLPFPSTPFAISTFDEGIELSLLISACTRFREKKTFEKLRCKLSEHSHHIPVFLVFKYYFFFSFEHFTLQTLIRIPFVPRFLENPSAVEKCLRATIARSRGGISRILLLPRSRAAASAQTDLGARIVYIPDNRSTE